MSVSSIDNKLTHYPNIESPTQKKPSSIIKGQVTPACSSVTLDSIQKCAKKCLAAVAALIFTVTVGLVITSVCCPFVALTTVYKDMRKKSREYYNQKMSDNVYKKRPTMGLRLYNKSLPFATIFRKPTESEDAAALKISRNCANQEAEYIRLANQASTKYTILAGIKYTARGIVTLPICCIGMTVLFSILGFQKIYNGLSK